jgi:hypothetical protein
MNMTLPPVMILRYYRNLKTNDTGKYDIQKMQFLKWLTRQAKLYTL